MTQKTELFLKIALPVIAASSVFFATAACIRYVPSAVTYDHAETEIQRTENADAGTVSKEYAPDVTKLNIEDSPHYIIKSRKENIVVENGEEKILYVVNADLCDFPQTDKEALENGIKAENREELFEIIEYLES